MRKRIFTDLGINIKEIGTMDKKREREKKKLGTLCSCILCTGYRTSGTYVDWKMLSIW